MRSGIPQAVSTFSIPRRSSPVDSASVFPHSRVIVRARSSRFDSSSAFSLKRCWTRSPGGVRRHSGNARAAAWTARSTSAAPESGVPVAGSTTGRRRSTDGAVHDPPTRLARTSTAPLGETRLQNTRTVYRTYVRDQAGVHHFRLSKALHVVGWNNHDEPGSDAVEHRVGKFADQSLTDIPIDHGVKFGHRRDSVENGLYAFGEFNPESRPLLLIPIERFVELSAGFSPQNNRESHRRARFKASALTSSQDTTSSGAASSAAMRRSSSSLKSSQTSGS